MPLPTGYGSACSQTFPATPIYQRNRMGPPTSKIGNPAQLVGYSGSWTSAQLRHRTKMSSRPNAQRTARRPTNSCRATRDGVDRDRVRCDAARQSMSTSRVVAVTAAALLLITAAVAFLWLKTVGLSAQKKPSNFEYAIANFALGESIP